jgi:hypothetical protein
MDLVELTVWCLWSIETVEVSFILSVFSVWHLQIPQRASKSLQKVRPARKTRNEYLPFSESLWTFDLSFSRSPDILFDIRSLGCLESQFEF